jgi:hypothetical protein
VGGRRRGRWPSRRRRGVFADCEEERARRRKRVARLVRPERRQRRRRRRHLCGGLAAGFGRPEKRSG